MPRPGATERPSDAQSLTTKELLNELTARGFVACRESRVKRLHTQRIEADESIEQWKGDIEAAIKDEMGHALAKTLMDQVVRFKREPVPWLSGVKFTADLVVILPPKDESKTDADAGTDQTAGREADG